ncbi:hypothetical protein FNU79_17600 [Deinococcus detaillensis]|uniref:Uncharacterized protein n=1 Tax=Deinococcus detaillensis TaxID=2592048 RepID=A0A553UHH1_9DEIO|nr:hypothetical protein [Deinococcus detaillensis]TSA79650.1 hypothetical protein FNU79_17600 [Deinococcus detaillensis]
MFHSKKTVLSLAALSIFTALTLSSCGGTTATAPDPAAVVDPSPELQDDVDASATDDEGGEVVAQKTIVLSAGQALAAGLSAQTSTGDTAPPDPVTVTATIVRATTGKYAGKVKGKLVLNYTGNYTYKGDFSLKLATAPDGSGNLYDISRRKNDSKDSPLITLRPTKNKPSTIKNLTIPYGDSLNGATCMYLFYTLKDNGGLGINGLSYTNQAPLLCETPDSNQTALQTKLLASSTGYLFQKDNWQFANLNPNPVTGPTLNDVPATMTDGTTKTDFETWFAPLMTVPAYADPANPTALEKYKAAQAKKAKRLHDAFANQFKADKLGVYVNSTAVYIVGVNSWGLAGLYTPINN